MSVYADSLFYIFLPSLDLLYDPLDISILFIDLISDIFAFAKYILIYLSKLTAPAAAATLTSDAIAAVIQEGNAALMNKID